MPHSDGPLYHPYVCIISLHSSCLFSFFANYEEYKNGKYLCKLFVEPRSLLIFTDSCYSEYLHTINDDTCDSLNFILKDEQLVCPISNIFQTSIYFNEESNIRKELSNSEQKNQIELSIPRNQRYSITLRHVYPKSLSNGIYNDEETP